ncbi:hypothetical protein [Okeania sp. SIO2B3]|uniref:hypothetical protein n=1 Tax=Okeania sp. SIO2B3 TaxID=2607784 RepID=UPI0013BFE726|nr:hypothetical protein [Okeania sp. SIO2B3]NET44163.1 hypothetical protein [Okeania sp. SIO2B3]
MFDCEKEVSFSTIKNLEVHPDSIEFDYILSDDQNQGRLYIWEITGEHISDSEKKFEEGYPFEGDFQKRVNGRMEYKFVLSGEKWEEMKEKFDLDRLNLVDGKYIIGITTQTSENTTSENTLSAAQLLIEGTPVESFDSWLVVTDSDVVANSNKQYTNVYYSVLDPSVLEKKSEAVEQNSQEEKSRTFLISIDSDFVPVGEKEVPFYASGDLMQRGFVVLETDSFKKYQTYEVKLHPDSNSFEYSAKYTLNYL